MADQFNLADELRRGGTGLLAQAVASLWKMRFRDQPYAALNEEEYAQAWLYARQQEAETAAVPSGNQAKAPTALDEMRALQEAAKCRNCGGSPGATELCLHCEHLRLRLELEESREALARVEAEREFWRRAAVTEGEYREQNNAIAARWQAECIKRDAVIEAARAYARVKQLGIHAAAEMNALEAALDQAASGPECAQKGHAYATNKGECCIYCFRPKAECLHMGEPASEAEVIPCCTDNAAFFTCDCDPEATESATKE